MFENRLPLKKATKRICYNVDRRVAVTRERVVYESLLVDDHGDGTYSYLSDVDLLFNQQRLDRMSLQALQQRLDDMLRAGDDGLSELRKNLTDADLQKFIKSRYIQSLSELRAWSDYLAEEYGNAETAIKDYLASLQKQQSDDGQNFQQQTE